MAPVLSGAARRKRWAPPPHARVDMDHHLAQGMYDCVIYSGANLVPGRPDAVPFGNVTRVGTPMGDGFYTPVGTSYDLATNGVNYTDDGVAFRPISLRFLYIPVTWPNGFTAITNKGATAGDRDFGINADTSGNLSYHHFAGGGANQGQSSAAVATGMTAGFLWDFTAVYDGNVTATYYVNGQLKGSVTLGAHSTFATITDWTMGRDPFNAAQNANQVTVATQSWVGRALDAEHVAQLYDDPFGMVVVAEPRRYTTLFDLAILPPTPPPAPTFVQTLGTGIGTAAAGTTTFNFSGPTYPQAGDTVILYGARDNITNDPATADTVSDGLGNTYSLLTLAQPAGTSTAAAGVVGVIAYSRLTTSWSGTVTLTWNHTNTVAARAMRAEHWRYISAIRSGYSNSAATTAGANISVTTALNPLAGDLVVGMTAAEYGTDVAPTTVDTDTTNGSWSTTLFKGNGTASVSGVKVASQYKVVTVAGAQTFGPIGGFGATTNVDVVAIVAVFAPSVSLVLPQRSPMHLLAR